MRPSQVRWVLPRLFVRTCSIHRDEVMSYKVAVVGATGNVGREILEILAQREFPVREVVALASRNSAGKEVSFGDTQTLTVQALDDYDFTGTDIALFSPGSAVSKIHAPRAAAQGCVVIDNTSQFRMDADVPLVVPEVNPEDALNRPRNVIANPNCTTIQMVVALKAIENFSHIKRVHVATYQAASGAGAAAMDELYEQYRQVLANEPVTVEKFAYQLAFNLIPQIDVFTGNGYTKEEQKIIDETKKIMGLPDLKITTTTVRVPVMGGHSESVNVQFINQVDLDQVSTSLANFSGIKLLDNPSEAQYPMPITAHDNDYVWVGRIRMDDSAENAINLWIVSDNLRKGAATNAIQIAEYLVSNELV